MKQRILSLPPGYLLKVRTPSHILFGDSLCSCFDNPVYRMSLVSAPSLLSNPPRHTCAVRITLQLLVYIYQSVSLRSLFLCLAAKLTPSQCALPRYGKFLHRNDFYNYEQHEYYRPLQKVQVLQLTVFDLRSNWRWKNAPQ